MIIVVSISGGKDSTATAILALETGHQCQFVFADTGHEHADTYNYLDYLESCLGIVIDRVQANFSAQIRKKRDLVINKWVAEGAVTIDEAEKIAELLTPTGIPFLDLCLWKGRFPSAKARFCTEELKHRPLEDYMLDVKTSTKAYVESWQGVRADESRSRSQLPQRAAGEFAEIYRPILYWSARDVFYFLNRKCVRPNRLYLQGMRRVGCMPCIHSSKAELRQIANRFPNEVRRVAQWERLVSQVSKRQCATFFPAVQDPVNATKDIDLINFFTHGIENMMEWAKTTRGGRQYDLLATDDIRMCESAYGLCE